MDGKMMLDATPDALARCFSFHAVLLFVLLTPLAYFFRGHGRLEPRQAIRSRGLGARSASRVGGPFETERRDCLALSCSQSAISYRESSAGLVALNSPLAGQ